MPELGISVARNAYLIIQFWVDGHSELAARLNLNE
jgi:hypothetical protein